MSKEQIIHLFGNKRIGYAQALQFLRLLGLSEQAARNNLEPMEQCRYCN